jgi:hypothetical protein
VQDLLASATRNPSKAPWKILKWHGYRSKKMNAGLYFSDNEDKSLIIECQTEKDGEKRRLVISFEKDPKQSFWFIISDKHIKPLGEGPLSELDIKEVKRLVEFRPLMEVK